MRAMRSSEIEIKSRVSRWMLWRFGRVGRRAVTNAARKGFSNTSYSRNLRVYWKCDLGERRNGENTHGEAKFWISMSS